MWRRNWTDDHLTTEEIMDYALFILPGILLAYAFVLHILVPMVLQPVIETLMFWKRRDWLLLAVFVLLALVLDYREFIATDWSGH